DAAEVVFEGLHRVEHRCRPVADAGVQAPAGGDEERETGAGLLVADADIALFMEWHAGLSLRRLLSDKGGAQVRRATRAGIRRRRRRCQLAAGPPHGVAVSRRKRVAFCPLSFCVVASPSPRRQAITVSAWSGKIVSGCG